MFLRGLLEYYFIGKGDESSVADRCRLEVKSIIAEAFAPSASLSPQYQFLTPNPAHVGELFRHLSSFRSCTESFCTGVD